MANKEAAAPEAGPREVKPRYDLIPLAGMFRRALALAEGARRWGPFSWRRDPAADGPGCLNHAIEHLIRYANGDRSEDHLGHAGANLDVLMDIEAMALARAPRPAQSAATTAATAADGPAPDTQACAGLDNAAADNAVAARPMGPGDLPTLKAWIQSSENVSGFDVKLAKGAKLLLVRRQQGGGQEDPLLFMPFWVSITVGCPIPRPGLGTAELHAAGQVAIEAVNFIAESQGVQEINTAVNDHATVEFLEARGFKRAGQFMRRRPEGATNVSR